MKNIIKQIKLGKLTRDIDEKYAGGFWDLAGSILEKYDHIFPSDDLDILQTEIYNALWSIYEETEVINEKR